MAAETSIMERNRKQWPLSNYLLKEYGVNGLEELKMKYFEVAYENVSKVFDQSEIELEQTAYTFPTRTEFFDEKINELSEFEEEVELMFYQYGTGTEVEAEVETEQTDLSSLNVPLSNSFGCNIVLITLSTLVLIILAVMAMEEPKSKRDKQTMKYFGYILLLVAVALLSYSLGYVHGQQSNLAVQIEPRSFTEDVAYIVFTENGEVYAKNGKTGEIEFQGTDASTVIQSVLDSLTNGRNYKERVVLKGVFTLTKQITVSSYTIFDLSHAVLKLSSEVNLAGDGIIKALNAIKIEIVGGILDANYPNNSYNNNGILLENCSYCLVEDVYLRYFAYFGIKGAPVYKSYFTGNVLESYDDVRRTWVEIAYGDDNDVSSNLIINGLINFSWFDKTDGDPELHRNKIHSNICIGLTARGGIRICDWSHETSIKNNIVMPYTSSGGIYGYVSERCEVIGNIVIGQGGTESNGIDFAYSKHILWEDNIVYNIGGNGFATDGTSNMVIKGNIAAYCGKNGFTLPYATARDRKVVLIGNIAYNNGQSATGHGFSISNSHYLVVANNIAFDDQETKTQNYGISLFNDCSYSIVKGNIVFGNTHIGIYLSGNNGIVEGNICRDNRWGITIYGDNIQVLNNQLINNFDGNFIDDGGTDRVIRYNVGYVTESSGVVYNLADGASISHGLIRVPSVVTLTCLNATYDGVPVIVTWNKELTGSTYISVNIYWANGTAIRDPVIAISWYAEV